MPNAPLPVPKAGFWEQIYADPDDSIGATYHPRVWFKGSSGWSRLPPFSSADLTVRVFIKTVQGWAFGSYDSSGGYPDEPVPTSIWIRR